MALAVSHKEHQLCSAFALAHVLHGSDFGMADSKRLPVDSSVAVDNVCVDSLVLAFAADSTSAAPVSQVGPAPDDIQKGADEETVHACVTTLSAAATERTQRHPPKRRGGKKSSLRASVGDVPHARAEGTREAETTPMLAAGLLEEDFNERLQSSSWRLNQLEQRCNELLLENAQLRASEETATREHDRTRELNVQLVLEHDQTRELNVQLMRKIQQLRRASAPVADARPPTEELSHIEGKQLLVAAKSNAATQTPRDMGDCQSSSTVKESPLVEGEGIAVKTQLAAQSPRDVDDYDLRAANVLNALALEPSELSASLLSKEYDFDESMPEFKPEGINVPHANGTSLCSCGEIFDTWGCSAHCVYPSSLLLAHRTLSLKIASGPPGLPPPTSATPSVQLPIVSKVCLR
jgi:hypothetical protein